MDNTKSFIKILLVCPHKKPEMVEIENSLFGMQEAVGGLVEEYAPFDDDVVIVCNEEGKILGMELNRAIYDDDHSMIDIIAGSFFIAYAPSDSDRLQSLPSDLADKYYEKFEYPEIFVRDASTGKIVAVPVCMG